MRRLSLLPRAGLFLFFAYLFPFGGTFNGVVLPQIKWVTLVLMTIIVALWLVTRWRQKWIWYRTSLDNVLILWAMAFGLSLLANSEVWRRILIGLWFVGVYLGVWYIVQDALANGALKRGLLVDAFLFAGLLVLIFGYIQLGSSSFDLAQFRLPRPGSTIGNPNSLGAYLIVLIALAAGRAAARAWMRRHRSFPRHRRPRACLRCQQTTAVPRAPPHRPCPGSARSSPARLRATRLLRRRRQRWARRRPAR